MKPRLDFYLFYGSIYTYLAVMRIERLAVSAGVDVRWRPFNLREILVEQNNGGFAKNSVRMNYCWRDVERRAARHGVPFLTRPPYPADPDLFALRAGIVAQAEGWCEEYTKATYRAWFVDHRCPGVGGNVEHVLASIAKPAKAIIVPAAEAEVSQRLRQQTDLARKRGIFGSPTFAVDDEVFWGDDRLEEAIEHALRRDRRQPP
jgi:2-hydroxychromene-2-carboxylate isomerase